MINESELERRMTARQDFINEYVAYNVGEYQDNSDCTMEAIENASDEMLKKLFDAISESKAAQTVVDCIVDAHLVVQARKAWDKEAGL